MWHELNSTQSALQRERYQAQEMQKQHSNALAEALNNGVMARGEAERMSERAKHELSMSQQAARSGRRRICSRVEWPLSCLLSKSAQRQGRRYRNRESRRRRHWRWSVLRMRRRRARLSRKWRMLRRWCVRRRRGAIARGRCGRCKHCKMGEPAAGWPGAAEVITSREADI